MAFTAFIANVTRMPASMPDAMEAGMREIARISGLNSPVTVSIRPTSMNAPTASLIEKPVLAPISAAPGVDHAEITGIFVYQESHIVSTAIARQRAVTMLAVCWCDAPTASAAAMIRASVPPKPTTAATKPETGTDRRMLSPKSGG